MKKILKYCFISIGILFLTLLILPFTLYIPAIQSWAKDLATTYASKQLNMSIAIERIRQISVKFGFGQQQNYHRRR